MLDNTYWNIPAHTYESIKLYVEKGYPPGGFLYAVLTNDLFEAVGRADSRNSKAIKEICGFIHNEIPALAWRTKEKVETWVKHHGLDGFIEIREVRNGISAEENNAV